MQRSALRNACIFVEIEGNSEFLRSQSQLPAPQQDGETLRVLQTVRIDEAEAAVRAGLTGAESEFIGLEAEDNAADALDEVDGSIFRAQNVAFKLGNTCCKMIAVRHEDDGHVLHVPWGVLLVDLLAGETEIPSGELERLYVAIRGRCAIVDVFVDLISDLFGEVEEVD